MNIDCPHCGNNNEIDGEDLPERACTARPYMAPDNVTGTYLHGICNSSQRSRKVEAKAKGWS